MEEVGFEPIERDFDILINFLYHEDLMAWLKS